MDTKLKLTKLEYQNMEEAWEGVNEYLANEEIKVRNRGGATYGSELVSYDNVIYIEDARLNPKFNFGRALGYSYKKWSKLVNNYVNFDYLDLVKSEIEERERKKSINNYNYTYHFDNSHGSGKDCLISLTFCRRKGLDRPLVIFYTRASEVTKRLAFDFLLIQRMVEYVYGKKMRVNLICHIPFMFINLECFLMYVSYKGEDVIKKGKGGYSPYQLRLLQRYHEFANMDVEKIKYKVHQRAAKQVQKDKNGNPISGVKDLFAKELKFLATNKVREKEINQLNSEV